MQQVVQRMFLGLVLARVIVMAIEVQGQPGDRLGEDSHTCVDCSHLHRGTLIYRLSGCRSSEEEAVRGPAGPVLRLVAYGEEKLGYDVHGSSLGTKKHLPK